MTYLNDLMIYLAGCALWVQTPDDANTLAAMIAIAALCGARSRACLFATVLLHLLLILL